ncbi:glycosyltransferase family 4 protein [Candidatus Woesebacteria bacterium]|nr:glycosyltransferase family 4 protein [Candidatus Woesebacteria bacterium]
MKILISISYYHPNISGLTLYAKRIAEEMSKKGHNVKVLTSLHDKSFPSKALENGVEVHRVWTPFKFGRGPIMPTHFIKALKLSLWADVINIHVPQFEGVFLAVFAKIFGKKIIMTHHCELSNWPGLVNQITEKVTNLSLVVQGTLSDKIVSYTKDYSSNSKYLKRFKDKVVLTFPPVKLEAKSNKKVTKNFSKAKYKIGFAGRIAKEKGIEYLLQAIPTLKSKLGEDIKIYLAGPSDEVIGGGYKFQLSSLINKHESNIEFVGSLTQAEMPSFYNFIDVLVLPSYEKIESFGFVQVESMLSGTPVVASNIPGVRIPVKKTGMGELSKLKDPKDLAKKIVKILKNKRKYYKRIKKAKKIFSYESSINFYDKLFDEK